MQRRALNDCGTSAALLLLSCDIYQSSTAWDRDTVELLAERLGSAAFKEEYDAPAACALGYPPALYFRASVQSDKEGLAAVAALLPSAQFDLGYKYRFKPAKSLPLYLLAAAEATQTRLSLRLCCLCGTHVLFAAKSDVETDPTRGF
jgi:hypothetical protein